MADWVESKYSRDTAMRFARSGALVRIICQDDACEVCRARAQKNYAPADVPRLPVRGCMNTECRCTFVAVDPATELTVDQLVERGITALRAGRTEIARETLRKAVGLDEMYEFGWLWLGAVVDDIEKMRCLEKALAINPRNQRARAGLEALQLKLARTRPLVLPKMSTSQPDAEEETPETDAVEDGEGEPAAPQEQAAPLALDILAEMPVPPPTEVFEIREEREIIAEQWSDFVQFAIETDPHMLTMQGQAFLSKLNRLGEQALILVPEGDYLSELQIQWEELEAMGSSLLETIASHHERRDGTRAWQAMNDALRGLAHELSEHGKTLRARITQAGGQLTRE